MNISNGERNLSSKLFLVELHSHNLVGKSFVKQSVDLGATGQLQDVDSSRSTSLYSSLKVLLELLYAPEEC